MQEGRRIAAWDHTAALIAHIRSSSGDKHAKDVGRYHPYSKQKGGQTFKSWVKQNARISKRD